MANKQRKGGIDTRGRGILFKDTSAQADELQAGDTEQPVALDAPAPSPAPQPEEADTKPEKPKSTRQRTTVTLLPETLAAMEQLRYDARRSGKKATMSDVLEEAVKLLVEERRRNP